MKSKILHEQGGAKSFALIFDSGDEVMAGLAGFAKDHRLAAAHLEAICALHDVTLGYFDWEKKDYRKIPLREQVEVLSLIGDIVEGENDNPTIHAHIVVGRLNGAAYGGHLIEAHVRPTLEVVLTESPAHLRKRFDPESHLALIRP